MPNYSKLEGKIKEVCDTQDVFAKKLGISRASLSKKLNGKVPFTQDEMLKSKEILNLDSVDSYFFSH